MVYNQMCKILILFAELFVDRSKPGPLAVYVRPKKEGM
jgi:hypothetical protein